MTVPLDLKTRMGNGESRSQRSGELIFESLVSRVSKKAGAMRKRRRRLESKNLERLRMAKIELCVERQNFLNQIIYLTEQQTARSHKKGGMLANSQTGVL